ncbi:uncharacterized protein Bfra_000265 [Botrytis fragariae]|uniref:Uncharacterized protein n=1 Tax=Botrytis fragariae TaxID=1964551 RepID=A0A8H6B2U1_9HELO|nr:uncharacterized protein Bfra_000265 [Botrytis fragariae]KAF5878098.1 hypothetical protein Bfra_000265 [Botrytis fragariae]
MTPRRIVRVRVKRLLLSCVNKTRNRSLPILQRGDQTTLDMIEGDLEFQPANSYLHASLDARHKERQQDFGT